MISCAILERPGKWRIVALAAGLLVAFTPALPLLFALGESSPASGGLGSSFFPALGRSLAVAAAVVVLATAAGLPAGVLAALYDFPARKILLALLALPLLVPSFLWAIGLSMLRLDAPLLAAIFPSGFPMTMLAFTALGLPLVLFVSFLSARGISRGQAAAARLAGGEWHLLGCTLRAVFPAAAFAALLAGVLTLADPGPGQILGFPGVGFELLTSFSAQYDFALAARQCLTLSGLVIGIILPAAVLLAPRLAAGLLSRDTAPLLPARTRFTSWLVPLALLGLVALTTLLPAAGLIVPGLQDFPAERVAAEVRRTLPNTFLYASAAAGIATALGLFLAFAAGRERRLRAVLLAAVIVLFALPPSLGALGVLHAGSTAPAQLDWLFRGKVAVAVSLALRCLPIAAIIAMRSVGTTSLSWASAAAVHGIPLRIYLGRVLLPWLLPAALLSALLCALIASADVGTVLLLHPPGEASLPLAIFTVMANAPESLVGALCLAYLGGAAVLMALGLGLARFVKANA